MDRKWYIRQEKESEPLRRETILRQRAEIELLIRWEFDSTLKCLSIGTPKTINFPFVSNEKLMIFRCPNIQAHDN